LTSHKDLSLFLGGISALLLIIESNIAEDAVNGIGKGIHGCNVSV